MQVSPRVVSCVEAKPRTPDRYAEKAMLHPFVQVVFPPSRDPVMFVSRFHSPSSCVHEIVVFVTAALVLYPPLAGGEVENYTPARCEV